MDPYFKKDNYPNPFNSNTTIRFEVGGSSFVRIDIYNLQGQAVRQLKAENFLPGIHHVVWDGTNKNGILVGSGIYIVSLKAGGERYSKKLLLLKLGNIVLPRTVFCAAPGYEMLSQPV